jgi:hypothetical protein
MTTLAHGHDIDHAYLTGHHTVSEAHGAPHSYLCRRSGAQVTAAEVADEQRFSKGPGTEWRAALPDHHEALVQHWEKNPWSMTSQHKKDFRKLIQSAPEVTDAPVYRGQHIKGAYGVEDFKKAHPAGSTVSFPRHSSTSLRPEVAAGFGRAVYEIHGHHAKGIGNTLHEAVMPPGKFRVHSSEWKSMPTRASIDGSTTYDSPHLHVVLHPLEDDQKQAAYVHEHPYLPTGRIFSPTKQGEDPRLFDGDHLRPVVRAWVLEQVGEDWDGPYPDWPEWATVYLAGGQASHWYGSGAAHGDGEEADDFDVLVAVDFDEVRRRYPELAGRTPAEIASALTQYFRAGFDRRNERARIPGVDGVWGATAYVNDANSRDIRVLHPYAAYDISGDRWAVRPVETPADWSARSLPESDWDYAESVVRMLDAIDELPEPVRTREGARLFDLVHGDRHNAFGEQGEGVFDLANVVFKYLDLHPDRPLERLVDYKRRAGAMGLVTARVRHVSPDGSPEPEGIMVAIAPPEKVVDALLVEGGETAENMHVTVSYLGSTTEYDKQQLDDVVECVRAWAETQQPFECRVQGAGTFVNDEVHVLVALVDAPALTRMHVDLTDYLRRHGYSPHEDHSFTAHLTLSYERHHVRFLPKITPVSWEVTELWVAVGGQWESVKLGWR